MPSVSRIEDNTMLKLEQINSNLRRRISKAASMSDAFGCINALLLTNITLKKLSV
jgi:hypothetical protein